MSIASIVTRGFIGGVNYIPTRGFTPGIPAAVITGGHFLPSRHKGKSKGTLSNIQLIYDKAKKLPRKETKELRDTISQFVEPAVARQATVPDIIKIDYAALEANQAAYDKFLLALDNIQKQIVKIEEQQNDDDELLLITIISCVIH